VQAVDTRTFAHDKPISVILIYFPTDIRTVVIPLLLQSYSLLIVSLVSILRQKLSPNDIDFTISAVHSPSFHFLLLMSLIYLFQGRRISPGPFHRFGYLRLPAQLLIVSVIPLWIVLSGITWLDIPALRYRKGQTCAIRLSFQQWLQRLLSDLVWIYMGPHLYFANNGIGKVINSTKTRHFLEFVVTLVYVIIVAGLCILLVFHLGCTPFG
jgi:hypothetical protein